MKTMMMMMVMVMVMVSVNSKEGRKKEKREKKQQRKLVADHPSPSSLVDKASPVSRFLVRRFQMMGSWPVATTRQGRMAGAGGWGGPPTRSVDTSFEIVSRSVAIQARCCDLDDVMNWPEARET